jgi:lactococcin 972 family bacteriocin
MPVSKRSAIATIVASVFAVGIAAPALATVTNVDGGTWSYGVDGGLVYSNYLHPTACHGSSVKGEQWVFSPNAAPGYWSSASATAAWRGNKAYYRTTC